MVVGVVVLLIAAIAFANRGSDDTGAPPGPHREAPRPRPGRPRPPARSRCAGSRRASRRASPQSEQGAQSAAANYAVALGSEGMFHTGTRSDIIRATHDPSVADSLLGELNQAYSPSFLKNVGLNDDGSAPAGLTTFVSLRTVPVGTKTTQQDDLRHGRGAVHRPVGLAGPGSTSL